MNISINGPGDIPVQYILNQNMSLSHLERRVINFEKEGNTIKEIAKAMNLSSRAIQTLIYDIRIKQRGKSTEYRRANLRTTQSSIAIWI